MAFTVGVLALQGDVREHLAVLERLGARGLPVRRASEVESIDALIIPGGESTTIARLARTFEVFEPIVGRIKTGMPTLGTCAGMVLLADDIRNGAADQETFGGLDVTVRRNAFGRQVDSFETDIDFSAVNGEGVDEPLHAVFIRAPLVERVGEGVQVLATVPSPGGDQNRAGDRIVAVQAGPVMATSFHPEVGGDVRVHRYFLGLISG